MSTIYLPTPMYTALETQGLDCFSVVECLKAGYGNNHTSYTNAAGYNYIYLQIKKLVGEGYLLKKYSGRRITFIKTKEYYDSTIEVCHIKGYAMSLGNEDTLPQLNKRYGHYEGYIQSLRGEQGEYDELVNLYPQYEVIINIASSQVHEEFNSTMGRIRAVKTIIKAIS
ncbi:MULTISPECIES: hypothetical protein [Aeromonas]|uniref:hypothetical protein n=1 Tax=Aeromonas TaxID=642 RepID=UPI0012D3D0DA|nr:MULTISPECIES: hypothetical protein [Aeromonas]MBL0498496.1 hypothetical protein [Aeromonas caviae]MCK0187059.1 hypothetical protein [Aeromonas hydrophila]MCR3940047.1 hypothetical protein [Aeromonas caviae]QSO23962.1 hypothetical protein JZM63_05755 [Aeromonas caviae]UOV89942.1 hypothetical protein MUW98_11620 [Aeromonas hydrophila]